MAVVFRRCSPLFCVLLALTACESGRRSAPTNVADPRTPRVRLQPSITFSLCAEGLPTTGMWKCDPVLADINGDSYPDLVALPRLGTGPRVWLGNGQGDWQEASSGLTPGMKSCGGGIAVADLNGDGFLDLAVADHCQGIFTYMGDGTGQWQIGTRALYPTYLGVKEEFVGVEDLDVGDLNNDGFLDIVACASDTGGINVYWGDGTGENWIAQESSDLPTTSWANRVTLYDVNGDGSLDIVASLGQGPRVWLNDGHGKWIPSSTGLPTPMMQGLFQGVALGDLNGDGRVDIAVANWIDGPEVFFQEEDGSWRDAGTVFPDMYGGAYGIALGDIDLDGSLDMVVSGRIMMNVGYVYGLFLLKGDGRGGWEYVLGTGLPETGLSTAWGVTMGDVNGDGVPDLVYATGGIVGQDSARNEPVMPTRLQVWCTQLPGSNRAVLAAMPKNLSE